MREFTTKRVREWLGRGSGKTLFIKPGSPWESGCVESFNGKLWGELLKAGAFDTVLEARVLIERWRQHYNTIRPHSALGYRPPAREARRTCAVATAATAWARCLEVFADALSAKFQFTLNQARDYEQSPAHYQPRDIARINGEVPGDDGASAMAYGPLVAGKPSQNVIMESYS